MATLHLINRSPARSDALAACLRIAAADDCILLIEDAVLAAVAETTAAAGLHGRSVFALAADSLARGVANRLATHVQVVDDAGFVELCVRCERVMSWF